MQLSEAEEQERLDYIFQHNYNRVEQAAKRLGKKGGKFSMKIAFRQGEGLRSSREIPDEIAAMEFQISVAKFALADEPYNIDQWLKFLRRLDGEQHSSEFDKMEKLLEHMKKGGIDLTMNQERITAYKAYETIAKRVIFANDVDAEAYSKELLKYGPLYHLMLEIYDAYCLEIWNFLQLVHDYRRQQGICPKPIERDNICIFCKAKERIFDHVEHTPRKEHERAYCRCLYDANNRPLTTPLGMNENSRNCVYGKYCK